ncbi:MAG: transglutaminase family protein [Methanobacteriota archaeon]
MKKMLLFLMVFSTLIISFMFFTSDDLPQNVSIILEHVSEDPDPYPTSSFDYEAEVGGYRGKLDYNSYYTAYTLRALGIPIRVNASEREKVEIVCDILSYFDNNFKYLMDFEDETKNVSETLIEGGGDCEDFTILFMSLIVTAGIPRDDVRGVKTYVNFTGTPVVHMYPEVRFTVSDKFVWLPIEVTKDLKTNRLYNTKNVGRYLTRNFRNIRRYYWFGFNGAGVFNNNTEQTREIEVEWNEWGEISKSFQCE